MTGRAEISFLISAELARQDRKWGDQSAKPMLLWLAILTEEVGEVAKAILEGAEGALDVEPLRRELVQVAAVAVAALEALEKQEATP